MGFNKCRDEWCISESRQSDADQAGTETSPNRKPGGTLFGCSHDFPLRCSRRERLDAIELGFRSPSFDVGHQRIEAQRTAAKSCDLQQAAGNGNVLKEVNELALISQVVMESKRCHYRE